MLPFYEVYPNFQTSPSGITVIHNARELGFATHIHSYIEILYVYSGVQHMVIDDVQYAVKQGEAAVIFPEIIHQYYRDGEMIADGLIVTCETKIFGGQLPDISTLRPKTPIISKEKISEDAVFEFSRLSEDEPLLTKLGRTFIIMQNVFDSLEFEKQERAPLRDITIRVMEYVAKNFTQPLTLDSIAKELNVSKYYVSHVFSDKIKMNFRNYLGLARAEYAAKMIRTLDDSLTDIGSYAGFDSPRTFNRVFHSVYGMTPREYRNHINKYINKNGRD